MRIAMAITWLFITLWFAYGFFHERIFYGSSKWAFVSLAASVILLIAALTIFRLRSFPNTNEGTFSFVLTPSEKTFWYNGGAVHPTDDGDTAIVHWDGPDWSKSDDGIAKPFHNGNEWTESY